MAKPYEPRAKKPRKSHQLSAYDVKTGVVLFQVNVQEKQNEISALKALLTPAFIKGRIFILEAMHTQTELCAKVARFGGSSLLVAKDHQPTLVEDLTAFFADPPWDWCWDQARRGTKHMGVLNIDAAFVAQTSMTGLPSDGQGWHKSFA